MAERMGCPNECPDRVIGCHSTCERYKTYREYLDKINRARLAENDANAYFDLRRLKYRGVMAFIKRRGE